MVPNAVWAAADPEAYLGGRVPTVAPSGRARSRAHDRTDNGALVGALEVIPTTADYVLDLIRRQQPLAAAVRRWRAAPWR